LIGAGGALALLAVVASMSPGSAPGTIAPGVAVLSAELGGKGDEAANEALAALEKAVETRELGLVVGAREIRITPRDLGFTLDAATTLATARAADGGSGITRVVRSWSRARVDIPMTFAIDKSALEELSPSWEDALIADHPFDGSITIENGVPKPVYPQTGHKIDLPTLEDRIVSAIASGSTAPIDVPLYEVVPPIGKDEVDAATRKANAILSGPITLTFTPSEADIEAARRDNEDAEKLKKEAESRAKAGLPKKKSRMKRKGKRLVEDKPTTKSDSFPVPQAVTVVFEKHELLAAFRARRVDLPAPHLEVELDEADVKRKLAPAMSKLFNAARDARFELAADGSGTVTIVPSRPGTRVDTARLVEALYHATEAPGRVGELPVDKNAEPKFTTEAAAALGIKRQVAEYTTHHACCQPRVKNIHRICDMLDGTILKAGDTFSVNAAVGPRTVERGFVVAPSIGDGEMTETPGGGVSQFATTLYNALFDGGYVVKERKPHSFYFNRYPMGIEATLSYPSPDLVFMNDTKAALLLRCEYTQTMIKVRLFGDNGGRKVDRRVSQPFDYTDPRIEYLGDPRREPEDPKTKDHGSHGFSVITTRTITLADGTKRDEKRTVKYTGKPRLIEVHPCEIPKGEKGHTGEKCPKKEEVEGTGGGLN
jgi:vancomycin resistance protein YoaR